MHCDDNSTLPATTRMPPPPPHSLRLSSCPFGCACVQPHRSPHRAAAAAVIREAAEKDAPVLYVSPRVSLVPFRGGSGGAVWPGLSFLPPGWVGRIRVSARPAGQMALLFCRAWGPL
ncbi:hypothetical protein PLESTB_000225600 [Pleodorina starrii]|uniref:Uncharacterized protein n=1 Tax=Pleodorina starrii TaxID=330485 RepID=A0A9W6EY07_9CHLO|nr:hypothetical protein PLESTB_000225600 [Pleodorina starrii]GLC70401.1 hypothetical protein PLESTF_000969500 [Pleodorina starrii]